MERITTRRWARLGAVVGSGALIVGAIAGCSGAAPGTDADAGSTDTDAALQEDVTLTWWTWNDWTQDVADAIAEEYPNVTFDVVKLENPTRWSPSCRTRSRRARARPTSCRSSTRPFPSLRSAAPSPT